MFQTHCSLIPKWRFSVEKEEAIFSEQSRVGGCKLVPKQLGFCFPLLLPLPQGLLPTPCTAPGPYNSWLVFSECLKVEAEPWQEVQATVAQAFALCPTSDPHSTLRPTATPAMSPSFPSPFLPPPALPLLTLYNSADVALS